VIREVVIREFARSPEADRHDERNIRLTLAGASDEALMKPLTPALSRREREQILGRG
jgi:hypothetical protein